MSSKISGRLISGVSQAGKQILQKLAAGLETPLARWSTGSGALKPAEDGCINPSDFQLGRHLQAGGKTFPADLNNYDAADGARYMDALDEISKRGLAKRISKDLYEFTSRGFDEARKLAVFKREKLRR